MTPQHDDQIQRWIDEALLKLRLGGGEFEVRWEWNASFTRRMGDALYLPAQNVGRVRLSTPLWPRADGVQHRQTVIHEVCHVADAWKSLHEPGYRRQGKHGSSWARLMLQCGLEPKRCHAVDRTGLARRATRVRVYCRCERGVEVTVAMHNKICSGSTYRCLRCKARVTPLPREQVAASEATR